MMTNQKTEIESLRLVVLTLEQEFLLLKAALCKTSFESEIVGFEEKLQAVYRADLQAKLRAKSEEQMLSAEIIIEADEVEENPV